MYNNKLENIIVNLINNNYFVRKCILIRNKAYLQPFDLNEVKKIEFPSSTSQTSEQIIMLKKLIKKFYDILSKNCTSDELKIFNKNIKTLKIIYFTTEQKKLFYVGNSAEYDAKNNCIMLYANKDFDTIYHEMLHMASRASNDGSICGFMYDIEDKTIGCALNEGYTELLTQRHLNKYNDDIYLFEKNVLIALEKIVGKKELQRTYFNCDLRGLFNILLKYYNKEEIEKFMIAFDFASTTYKMKYINNDTKKILLSKINYIVCFLFYGYCKKLKHKNYTVDEIQNLIFEYSGLLNFHYGNYNESCKCYNAEKIVKILLRYFYDVKLSDDEKKSAKIIF